MCMFFNWFKRVRGPPRSYTNDYTPKGYHEQDFYNVWGTKMLIKELDKFLSGRGEDLTCDVIELKLVNKDEEVNDYPVLVKNCINIAEFHTGERCDYTTINRFINGKTANFKAGGYPGIRSIFTFYNVEDRYNYRRFCTVRFDGSNAVIRRCYTGGPGTYYTLDATKNQGLGYCYSQIYTVPKDDIFYTITLDRDWRDED